jgi:glycosyltransferase involved in cell wall biosynthesis
MNIKVSVIIPVYNTAPYLQRCLDSICGQTWRNLEIICVNDCTPDNSSVILKEYAEKDKRFRIITHSSNRGLSAARNTGMSAARGKYIYFIDSDDWIDHNYIETMLVTVERENVNIVVNSNILCENEKNSQLFPQKISFNRTGFIDIADYINDISCTVFSYIWKKDFLDRVNANFPEGLIHEDLYFQQTTLVHLKYIYLINSPAYHYLQRRDSITGYQTEVIYQYDIIYIIEEIYKYFVKFHLLETFKICFIRILYRFLLFADKQMGFTKMKHLFLQMINDINNHRHFYMEDELLFFDMTIAASDSIDFENNYLQLIFEAQKRTRFKELRNKILNNADIRSSM